MRDFHRILCLFFLFCLAVMAGCSFAGAPQETTGSKTPDVGNLSTASFGNSGTPDHAASPTLTPAPTPQITPTLSPTIAPTATPVRGGNTSKNPNYAGKKIIALTFDDGPDKDTPALLDMLKDKGVPATFFVLGSQLKNNTKRQTLARASAEGHEIGTHTYSHPRLTEISDEEILTQIKKSCDLIRETTGKETLLMRPPYGAYNQHIIDISGMAFVLWNIDTEDWFFLNQDTQILPYAEANGITTEEATDILTDKLLYEGGIGHNGNKIPALVSRIRHGCILLFHDVHPGTRVAVEKLIDELNKTGEYVFMTVSDMIETESRAPQAGDRYTSMWLNAWGL